MANIVIKNLATYQELTKQESANVTGGALGDAIVNHYGFLNTQLGPYDPAAHQIGAYWGNYWGSVLDNAATYGPPGSFSEILYAQVMPFMLSGNW